VGKKDGANPSRLIGEINDFTGNRGIRVGKTEIMISFPSSGTNVAVHR
jgi:hypothetical protein